MFSLFLPAIAFSQASVYKKGLLTTPDSTHIEALIKVLRNEGGKIGDNWAIQARELYFGSLYTEQLTDLVLFFDHINGTLNQSMVRDDIILDDRILSGKRSVYVLAFMNTQELLEDKIDRVMSTTVKIEGDPDAVNNSVKKNSLDSTRTLTINTKLEQIFKAENKSDSTHTISEQIVTQIKAKPDQPNRKKEETISTKELVHRIPVNTYCGDSGFYKGSENLTNPSALQIKYTALEEHRDPVLRRAINSIGALIGGVNLAHNSSHHPKDTTQIAPLMYLGQSAADNSHLYLAMTRLDIAENAWNRITVCGDRGLELPGKARAAVYNFGNSSYSKFRLGIASGLTYRVSDNYKSDTEMEEMLDEGDTQEENMHHHHHYIKPAEPNPELSDSEVAKGVRPRLFIYATYYPEDLAPPNKASLGLSVGTSVSADGLFNDFFLSVTAGTAKRGWPRILIGYSVFKERDTTEYGPFIGFGLDL
ncbi:MAG: hypothetical protein AAF564_12610 [Bacteroidota bacterium]